MTQKIFEAIERLPDDPDTNIVWVCYNEDMKAGATKLIKLLKGEDCLNHCRVVSREKFDVPLSGSHRIYYSPDLYDQVGNGAN